MSMEPLISVIVPVYKVEHSLSKCVESIRNQVYANLEIILIDDGSPDKCPELCDELASRDDRIIVIHKKNSGLSDARNAGIKISRGEYISFVDSDDYVEPTYISNMFALAQKHSADLVICSFFDENPTHTTLALPDMVCRGIDLFVQSCENKEWRYVVAWNKLYSRKLCDSRLFASGRQHEDEFAFHKILCKSNIVCVTSSLLYHYTYNKNGIMSQDFSIKNLDLIDALLDRLCFAFSNNLYTIYDPIFENILGLLIVADKKLPLKTNVDCLNIFNKKICIIQYVFIAKILKYLNKKNQFKALFFILSPHLCLHILGLKKRKKIC